MPRNTSHLFGRLRRARREELSVVRRITHDARIYNRIQLRPALWDAFIFLLLTFVLAAVAFLGRPPHAPIVQLHQRPKFTFEAPFDFTYASESALRERQQVAAMRVPPVFRVDTDSLESTVTQYRRFAKELASMRDVLLDLPFEERVRRIQTLPSFHGLPGAPRAVAYAAATAVEQAGSGAYLEFLINDALPIFEDLCRRGIYDESTFPSISGVSAVGLVGGVDRRRELSVIEARRTLLQNIHAQAGGDAGASRAEQDVARSLARSVADILNPGLGANIRMDDDSTRLAREAASAAVKSIEVAVPKGTELITRDGVVDKETLERWKAFRAETARREALSFGLTRTFLANTLWGVAIMALVVMYSRLAAPRGPRPKRAMTLVALAVTVNLLLLRLSLSVAESGLGSFAGEAVQWVSPWALAPLIVVVLAGPHMAIVAALLIAGFASAMHGNNLQVLLASMLASLVAVRAAREVRARGSIVTAGVLSSLPVALIAFYDKVTAADWMCPETFTVPLAALGSGLLTGVVAAGLIPYLENLFKFTTDITLLELTDYNRPLLRKLQILAPGTFHHSVMVANIAERAAGDIGANALLCRCAALYHDIGKMAKPEYFTENRHPGAGPHDAMAPSMSALVIKSHVREGVEIAREYRLPRVIIDIIEQHHGTGLIRFFHHKACKAALAEAGPGADDSDAERFVDESLYRYDGPKPATREAAVMLLADSVEAASRSLRKVTPQSVEDLVDSIVSERIEDGQFDECPLSFREVCKLRASLKSSLLNSLHQRVEYPSQEPAKGARK